MPNAAGPIIRSCEAGNLLPKSTEFAVSLPTPVPVLPRKSWRWRSWVVVLLLLGFPVACAVGVTGYFRLSSPTKALRESVMSSIPGEWEKRFAVHVGSLTMGLVRAGSRLVPLPPEPRAALDTLHRAEFGLYRLPQEPASVDYQALFLAADRVMRAHGWARVAGVIQGQKLVAIYLPDKGISTAKMECCLMVLHERDLILASARGDLEPLLELARSQWQGTELFRQLHASATAPQAQ